MIVDCYTCIWDSPARLGRGAERAVSQNGHPRRPGNEPPSHAGMDAHRTASQPVDTSIVLGFKSLHLESEVPNAFVADYVRRDPDRLIGFAGVDPTEPNQAIEELQNAREELGMRGLAISPSAQNLHPCHTSAKTVYEAAANAQMPVLFHSGLLNTPECALQYGQPVLLDEVAREFPRLKIVIAHMGYPWTHETIALLAKHNNVYADISWLLHQPWTAYQALVTAHQSGVIEKLLFGSGFPYTHAAACIEALYSLNHMVHGTNLPAIPREQLRGIVERDALAMLGIATNGTTRPAAADASMIDEEED